MQPYSGNSATLLYEAQRKGTPVVISSAGAELARLVASDLLNVSVAQVGYTIIYIKMFPRENKPAHKSECRHRVNDLQL